MRSYPEVTTRQRQALRAYQDYLDRNPDGAEVERVIALVEEFQEKWLEQLHAEALTMARRALDAGQPGAAVLHLDRAERLRPGDPEVQKLRDTALRAMAERDQKIRRSLGAVAVIGIPLDRDARRSVEALATAVLVAPLEQVAMRGAEWRARYGEGPLSDEARFLEAFGPRARGDEDGFFADLRDVARADPARSNMARHARRVLRDPEQNPYAFYRAARSAERGQRTRALLLGSRAQGALRRGLPRPLEYLIDLPGIIVSFATFPIRLLQYDQLRTRFVGPVLHGGERYLAHFPRGIHADEVHGELETLYAQRGAWSQALVHHLARSQVDPSVVADYREHSAERLLEAAGAQRRVDVRVSLYRSVISDYPETAHAVTAQQQLAKLLADHTPQSVRLSREFLLEHPPLWARDALGLRPVLLDGEARNGELDERGITLVGLSLIRIDLAGRESVVQKVPPENFRRFVARLEEIHYRTLATDPRELRAPDPQRDLFLERARLGLLADSDLRPSASSEAVFESSHEKHGFVKRRDSVLPVELVLQGGLADFAFSAFPRIKEPGATPDAFLYQ